MTSEIRKTSRYPSTWKSEDIVEVCHHRLCLSGDSPREGDRNGSLVKRGPIQLHGVDNVSTQLPNHTKSSRFTNLVNPCNVVLCHDDVWQRLHVSHTVRDSNW